MPGAGAGALALRPSLFQMAAPASRLRMVAERPRPSSESGGSDSLRRSHAPLLDAVWCPNTSRNSARSRGTFRPTSSLHAAALPALSTRPMTEVLPTLPQHFGAYCPARRRAGSPNMPCLPDMLAGRDIVAGQLLFALSLAGWDKY